MSSLKDKEDMTDRCQPLTPPALIWQSRCEICDTPPGEWCDYCHLMGEARPRPNLKQSRRGSLVEAVVNVTVGFGISVALNSFVLPFWGYYPTIGESVSIAVVFTVASVMRSYVLRRLLKSCRVRKIIT